ncbi:MAG: hypothetical protein CO088_04600 [Candidatus Yonathbacteria bacterium CG_4_9_14_0_8_um_filter_46_47]|uniref:Uncharacterized protein n=2 Tax=Parcubacteria group TaxID=1794811 RepID=A0A2M8D5C3_9BACT|nr:MAG: hypothetical protein CO088_04600 [Candidatus Yonathbacteria bacterium CG_4_9_14_0_8_um_filter_46_47]
MLDTGNDITKTDGDSIYAPTPNTMKPNHIFAFFLGVVLLFSFTAIVDAQTIGMVANMYDSSVTVFDTDTDTVLGVVALPEGEATGDIVIDSYGARGFVAGWGGKIFVVDLSQTPPRFADGVNPIFTPGSPRRFIHALPQRFSGCFKC